MEPRADDGLGRGRKQRKTRDLGWNRSRDSERIYRHIEDALGKKYKTCTQGGRGASKRFGLVHEGPNPVPIREFWINKAYVDSKTGEVVIKNGDGLQGACMKCQKAYRRARLDFYHAKYDPLTPEQIYANYRKEYHLDYKVCSRCKLQKKPEEFSISRGMETGMHNTCTECARAYSESVGGRWAVYSPDGHEVTYITRNDSCQECGSQWDLTKDHIWPIAKGGTDNKENIQVLCGTHNGSKSDTIVFKSLDDIEDGMICERYWGLLRQARGENWPIGKFDLEMTKAVRDFIASKCAMGDDELRTFFEDEKRRNNRKHNIEYTMRKFREYCGTTTLDVSESIEDRLQ